MGEIKSKLVSIVFAFEFSDVITLVVPISKLVETVKLDAVAIPVKAGLTKGAFRARAVFTSAFVYAWIPVRHASF